MTVWFEGEQTIEADLDTVRRSVENPGQHFVGAVGRMPGLTTVELVEQGDDFVTIRTNEGLMLRTNVASHQGPDRIVMEFDEEYQAGSKVTTTSHFVDEFTRSRDRVHHRTVVSDVAATGFLGFLYRRFGASKMGAAFLGATKAQLES